MIKTKSGAISKHWSDTCIVRFAKFHKITTNFELIGASAELRLLKQKRCDIFAPIVNLAGGYKNGAIRNNIEETAF